jgi:hypothetical protein
MPLSPPPWNYLPGATKQRYSVFSACSMVGEIDMVLIENGFFEYFLSSSIQQIYLDYTVACVLEALIS